MGYLPLLYGVYRAPQITPKGYTEPLAMCRDRFDGLVENLI